MSLSFSEKAQSEIIRIRKQYKTAQAACMPLLHLAQDEFGYLSEDALNLVADTLELSLAHVFGVATFYTMYHTKPKGKQVLMMCTNVSCMLKGAYDSLHELENQLGIRAGQTTKDGEFTLIEEECLAACADGPALVCGEKYFLNLTKDKVLETIKECLKMSAESNSKQPGTAIKELEEPHGY